MNNDEFLKRLSEVSEWHRPQTGPSGAASINKRARSTPEHPGAITQAQLDLMTDEEAQDYYDRLVAWREAQPNESISPEITKVNVCAVECEDCGKTCPSGRKVESKISTSGRKHWRTRCVECKMYKDPATGEFTLESPRAHTYLTTYYRPKLGLYKSKYQPEVKAPEPRVKERLQQLVQSQEQFQMVAYDNGDSVVYVREPISKP